MKTPSHFLRRWALNCAAGELLGIGAAGLIAVGYLTAFGEAVSWPERIAFLLLMLVAGAVEGSLLGWFQSRVLTDLFPGLNRGRWLRLTLAVAVLGWLLGMMPSTLISGDSASGPAADPSDSPLLFFSLTAGAGLFLGAVFGWFQWFELRRHTPQAARWVVANALGWAVALSCIYLAASWPDAQTPAWQIVVSGIVGGLAGGGLLGLITGLFLLKLKPFADEPKHSISILQLQD
ncbi:hypothetical protein [Tellurirhabdus rosea]|uniref:hypothetical protein n=1 Tax=Tellurirhabdus rosea TaxID=2674997 RepID=UPI00224CA259|nr:hypothetical protein [Tellurirhabdus rosea]